jgi:thioredoxin reductase
MDNQQDTRFDVVIIGGGVAGQSAALVMGRARRRVVVVDDGRPRNAPASAAYGFLSRDGMPPHQLLAISRAELEPYGVHFVDGTVEDVEEAPDGWDVTTADGRTLRGRQLVLASGLRDVLPDLPGARETWGRGLLQCPYCHGWEVRDQALGVLGTAETSIQQALLVRQWSEDVTFFPHGTDDLRKEDEHKLRSRGIRIAPGAAAAFVLEQSDDGAPQPISGVRLTDGQVIPCTAVFCEPEAEAGSPLLSALGCELRADGCVSTDEIGRTSVHRTWAVGNAADPAAQLIPAAGDAYRVAVAINAFLVEEDCAAEAENAVHQEA